MNALIYGEPGCGKTRIIGTCDAVPEMRKVCLLDVDGGAITLKETYPNVDVYQVDTFAKLQKIYDALRAGGHGYQTVGLDTITETNKYNMMDVMKALVQKDPNRNEYVPDRREWGINSEMTRRMIRAFRNLPLNVIMTAHLKDTEDQTTGRQIKRPDLPGQLSRQVAGFFDIVGFMYERQVKDEKTDAVVNKRLIGTKGIANTVAKDRFNKLPRIFEVKENGHTMQEIYQLVHGGKK
jgi:phage nucleotide-binding protein